MFESVSFVCSFKDLIFFQFSSNSDYFPNDLFVDLILFSITKQLDFIFQCHLLNSFEGRRFLNLLFIVKIRRANRPCGDPHHGSSS